MSQKSYLCAIKLTFLVSLAIASATQSNSVLAGSDDSLALIVGASERYESNLFRLPDTSKETVQAKLGKDNASDKITIGYGELKFDQTYSLQHVQLDAKVSNYRYDTFDYLNFTSTEYDAAWGWSVTPHVKGNMLANRQEIPESYSDYNNYSVRNTHLTENRSFSLNGYLFGAWYLVGGLGRSELKNSAIFREQDDYETNYVEYGLKYDADSGNFITLLGRNNRGNYTGRDVIPAQLLDDRFKQRDLEAQLNIAIFEKSKATATITQFEREHEHFSQRDYSGTSWKLGYLWVPTAKLSFNLTSAKRYDSYQDLFNSYVVNNIAGLSVSYATTAKSALSLSFSEIKRDFRGGVIEAPFRRNDTTHISSLGWNWALTKSFSFAPDIAYQRRNALIEGSEYDSFSAGLSVIFTI